MRKSDMETDSVLVWVDPTNPEANALDLLPERFPTLSSALDAAASAVATNTSRRRNPIVFYLSNTKNFDDITLFDCLHRH